jgi:DNA-binding transcriptional LysR family regulator
MGWRSVKFDWNRARAFLVTAEEGSLSAAARALGMAQPTLGRQVSALEEELGVVLFERVGRGLSLTPSGLELLEHVRAMGEAAGQVSLTASGQSQNLDGTICLTASQAISAYLLPPVIAKLRREHPGIDVELVASNAPSDLRRREADIAVRSFRPTQPDLVAKKVTEVPAHLYAATAYLERIGFPSSAKELSEADFIGFDREDTLLNGLNGKGLSLTQASFVVVTQDHLVQWQLVKAGVGIGLMSEDIASREPLVQQALPGLAPFMIPMWLTTHREVHTSRRVRRVFDLLVEALSQPQL